MYFIFSRRDLLVCFSLNLRVLIYVLNTPGFMLVYLPDSPTLSYFTVESIQLKNHVIHTKQKSKVSLFCDLLFLQIIILEQVILGILFR